jgi:hypothetical protein
MNTTPYRLPGSSKNLTEEDRAIFDAIKARVGDKTIGAQYRLDDFHDAELMLAMTVFNAPSRP